MDAIAAMFASGSPLANAVDAVDSFVWGWAMIVLLLGTHLIMTIRTRFIQRKIGTAIIRSVCEGPVVADATKLAAFAPQAIQLLVFIKRPF